MRLYSSFAAHLTVVRKDGYYMSLRTATRVSSKLAGVLELTDYQVDLCVKYLTGFDMNYQLEAGMTPSEIDTIRRVLCWYSKEYINEAQDKACIVVNLNNGHSLVIIERAAKAEARS